jgi:hypothetical protein
MNTYEMMERFRQFASADLSLTTPNRMHQVSEVLLTTSTVRIILTRYEDKAEDIEVDVEVSLPPLPESSDMAVLQGLIDTMIETLEYLKCLISIGFGLDLLQEEGILIASGRLSTDTKEHVFEVLRPPD